MTQLALHGFLGSGEDWSALSDQWEKPNLFSEDCKIPLTSFGAVSRAVAELCNGGEAIGYSLGGRILLAAVQEFPDAFTKVHILAAHPGGLSKEESQSRLQWSLYWAKKVQKADWGKMLKEWNNQPIFAGSKPIAPKEKDFRKDRLEQALRNLSVINQPCNWEYLKDCTDKMTWVIGDQDQKYVSLYNLLQSNGVINDLKVIPGAGHRLLQYPETISSLGLE